MELHDEGIDALIEASDSVEAFFRNLSPGPGQRRELPSVAKRRDKQFIRIPLRLFEGLVPLPGKALAVYLLLWRRHQMEHKPTTVQLTAAERKRCRLTRWQTTRALEALDHAGFIRLERYVGKRPQVTLRSWSEIVARQESTS